MIAGIVLFALGVKKVLEHTGDPLKDMPAVALCGGLALYLLAHVAFRLRNTRSVGWRADRRRRVCLAVIPVALEVSGVATLAILLARLDRADRLRGHARRRGARAASGPSGSVTRGPSLERETGEPDDQRGGLIVAALLWASPADAPQHAGVTDAPCRRLARGRWTTVGVRRADRPARARRPLDAAARRRCARTCACRFPRTPATCRRWPAIAGRSPGIARASPSREAGDYAIRFESVNHRARVWLDGRPSPATPGPTCRSRRAAG